MKLTFNWLLRTALLLIFFVDLSAAHAVTFADLLNPVGYLSATISPDGEHIAAIAFTGTNHGLILIDTKSMKAKLIIAGREVHEDGWIFEKAPRAATWVTNDLIAVDYGLKAESVDLQGRRIAKIGERALGKFDVDDPTSAKVVVFTDTKSHDLAWVDARSGALVNYRLSMSGKLMNWAFDAKGELRAISVMNSAFWSDASTVTNWYRASANSEWRKLAEFKITEPMWSPMYVSRDDDSLVVSSNLARDTNAVFKYDFEKNLPGELMAGHPSQDISVGGESGFGTITKVVTNGLKPTQLWLDPIWSRVQTAVDGALPDRVNLLSGDPKKKVLVHSYGDTDPGTWLLLDTANSTMREVAKSNPTVDRSTLQPMQSLTYSGADGLAIPAYLTLPSGDAMPRPTVVLIHGGPTDRNHWEYNFEVQLLAAAGYAVFQPQFRGSTGFGAKFEQAGYRQWGLAMQDDITAGVQYLIKNRIADPGKICIYGASYGGYAALWGAVKTPRLYQCAVSFAGVADIEAMLSDRSDSNGDSVAREVMRSRIGDLKVNKTEFDAVSPLKHADEIVVPLLIMHGDSDKRVPISHSKKMIRALKEAKKNYEWVEFENEGHGLYYVKNMKTYYATLLSFLSRHIGPFDPAVAAHANDVQTSAQVNHPERGDAIKQ